MKKRDTNWKCDKCDKSWTSKGMWEDSWGRKQEKKEKCFLCGRKVDGLDNTILMNNLPFFGCCDKCCKVLYNLSSDETKIAMKKIKEVLKEIMVVGEL